MPVHRRSSSSSHQPTLNQGSEAMSLLPTQDIYRYVGTGQVPVTTGTQTVIDLHLSKGTRFIEWVNCGGSEKDTDHTLTVSLRIQDSESFESIALGDGTGYASGGQIRGFGFHAEFPIPSTWTDPTVIAVVQHEVGTTMTVRLRAIVLSGLGL